MPIQVLNRGRFNRTIHIPNEPLDDPNAAYNGVAGRLPLSPNPVPAGYPTPWTTGLRGAGVDVASLTPNAGGVTYSTPGVVIEDIDFSESVQLNAANITFRRCRITSSDFFPLYVSGNATNAVVEDCRIRGVGSNPAAAVLFEGADFTLRRCDISGGADNIKIGANNATIENCYSAGGYFVLANDSHNDGYQSGGGSNLTISNCTIISTYQEQTSCCIFKADFSNITGINLTGNYFSGGNNCLIFFDVGANVVSGVVMTDNRFELDSWNINLFPSAEAYKSVGDMAAGFTETGTQVISS